MTEQKIPVSRLALFGAAGLAIVAVGIGVSKNRGPAAAPPAVKASTSPQADVDTLISTLEAKLKTNPNDAEGWRMLAWSFFETGRSAESATAYKKAAQIAPNNAEYWSSLGEALVLAGSGDVPKDASAAFKRALAIDPKDPRSRYFLAVEKDLKGDHKGALDDWLALLKDTPAGAPWDNDLQRTIEQVGKIEKIDVAGQIAVATANRPTAAPPAASMAAIPGPTQDQLAAASSMPPSQQQAMAEGMVASLAAKMKANPSNVDGWIMLMRSYRQLGRDGDAKAALASGLAANPSHADELRSAAASLGLSL